MSSEHHIELDHEPAASLELVSREAENWGGNWRHEGQSHGRLALPVVAGLRHGWVEGPLTVEPSNAGSRLTFRVEKSAYHLQKTSVLVLALAGLGALVFLVAPFVPALWPTLPLGFMLAVGAWFFIVAGLRNSGPEEFLATLAHPVGDESVAPP